MWHGDGRSAIVRAGLPIKAPDFPAEAYIAHMQVDKKAQDGDIRFILIDGPGQALLKSVPMEAVRKVIAESV